MSEKKLTEKEKKAMRRAAIAGSLLAVCCHFLPHDYQALCGAIVKFGAVSCGGS